MEKFGIFELLDTLSAIMAPNPADGEPIPAENKHRSAPASETEKAEIISPKQSDSAFAPPSFGGEQTLEAQANRNALDTFLQRHDAISKKIDKT